MLSYQRGLYHFRHELIQTQASTGVLLGIALTLAVERTYIRLSKLHKLLVDDYFLILAAVTLLAGTTMIYINVPVAYLQVSVEAGLPAPPPDLLTQLIEGQKTQNAATVLLQVSIFSVKLSFLFFRTLMRRVQGRHIWWWRIVFIIVVPSAIVCICSNFISCPYTGSEILCKKPSKIPFKGN